MSYNTAFLKDFNLGAYSDEQLIELSCQQLPIMAEAFTVLMKRYQSQVHRFCLRYLRQEDDAWEVSQEVFLRVFRHLNRFQGRASFRSWLYKIVHNQCNSFARKRTRYQYHIDFDEVADVLAVADDGFVIDSGDAQLGQALARLSLADQTVLRLRYFEDQSLQQLANIQGISLSAAKMRLYRAQERLKRAYQAAS